MQAPKPFFRCLALAFLVLLSCFSSFAQNNFIPGYIVTSKGDSINGYVDYRNWSKNPEAILFKQSLESSATAYTPSTISKFGVAEEHYVKAIVEIETSPRSVNQLREGADYNIHVDTVFLLVLVAGDKSLYCLKTTANPNQFYIKQQTGEYELLYYKKYLTNATSKVGERKGYIRQLQEYLTECPNIHSKIDKSAYNINSIQGVFKAYYSCRGIAASFQNQQSQSKILYGVIGGVSHHTLSASGQGSELLLNTDFQPIVSFSIGGFINVKLPRKLNRWSFYNDLTFNPGKFTGYYQDYVDEEFYTNYNTTLSFNYLKLSTLIRYQHPFNDNFSMFLNGGVINGGTITSTVETERFNKRYSTETTAVIPAVDSYRKFEQGLVGGLGANFGKLAIEIRVENGNGFSNIRGLKTRNLRYAGLLSYSL